MNTENLAEPSLTPKKILKKILALISLNENHLNDDKNMTQKLQNYFKTKLLQVKEYAEKQSKRNLLNFYEILLQMKKF